jgi:hydroxymethylbilane synthase
MLAVLEAGCSAPVGGHAIASDDNVLSLTGLVATVSGSRGLRHAAVGETADAEGLGRRVAEALLADGAAELMEAGE